MYGAVTWITAPYISLYSPMTNGNIMLIYLSMVVPVITAIILYVYWKRKTVWWEFLIPFGASLLLCCIMKWTVESVQTADTEWWTGAVTSAEYYEPWDEEVACRHPKYKTVTRTRTRTDSKGRTETYTETEQVQDGYEHMYDVDYHPAYWQVIDTNGITVGINDRKFAELTYKFGNRSFVNMNRRYHSINGNKYVAKWDGSDEKCEVCTTEHSYKNRLIASNSVFKFPEPDSKEGLVEYPRIGGFYDSQFILGAYDPIAERKLALWNARNGREKQCRLIFIIYNDMPVDVALNQENHWQGGNKNEFIVGVGVSGGNVKWAYIISWTENELLKSEVKQLVLAQDKLELVPLVDKVGEKVKTSFARKHFKDFDYLTVEPPFWTVALTFILTIAINVGISVWIVKNEFEDGVPSIKRFKLYQRA